MLDRRWGAGRLRRLMGPLSLSLGLHALVVGVVALLAVTIEAEYGAALDGADVRLSLDNPLPTRPTRDQSAAGEASSTSHARPITPRTVAPLSSAVAPAVGTDGGKHASIQSLVPDQGASAGALGGLRFESSAAAGVTFAGVGARSAKRIAYVVDASGAVLATLPDLLRELQGSVAGLSSTQQFAVILFRDRPARAGEARPRRFDAFDPTGSGRPALVRATRENRDRLDRWLQGIVAGGRSNPSDGLAAALALDPDVVFVLTRSIPRTGGERAQWDRGRDAVLADLERLNPRDRFGRRRVVIRTIQLIDPDPSGIMQAIGKEHGGQWLLPDPVSASEAELLGHTLLKVDELRGKR